MRTEEALQFEALAPLPLPLPLLHLSSSSAVLRLDNGQTLMRFLRRQGISPASPLFLHSSLLHLRASPPAPLKRIAHPPGSPGRSCNAYIKSDISLTENTGRTRCFSLKESAREGKVEITRGEIFKEYLKKE